MSAAQLVFSNITEAIEAIRMNLDALGPKQISYLRTLATSGSGGILALTETEWPPGVMGTGLNVLQICSLNVANRLINAQQRLQYNNAIGANLPELRCHTEWKDLSAILYVWPKQHPEGGKAFEGKLLSEHLHKGTVELEKLYADLLRVLSMLLSWRGYTQRRTRMCSAAILFENLAQLRNPPIPPNAARLIFDLDGVPALPNPVLFSQDRSSLKEIRLNTELGVVHGSLTADRIMTSSIPIVLDWNMSRSDFPVWIDHARLELDLLLRLVPPSDPEVWYDEWPSLAICLRSFPLEPTKAKGRIVPSALSIVRPIRESLMDQPSNQSVTAFLLAAVRAGLDVMTDPVQSGTTRLAAALYGAVALDVLQQELGLALTEGLPSSISWPGLLSWRSLPTSHTSSGYALLVGAGFFPKDGSITQLPQVRSDLEELASFLHSYGYEVHILLDDDFTKSALDTQLELLHNQVASDNRPFIMCFCGHGVPFKNGYYLLTGNMTSGSIETEAVDFSHLLEVIGSMSKSRTLVLLNSCFSGQTLSVPLELNSIGEHGEFALLVSASPGEESYMLRDDPYSLFIGSVLEAMATLRKPDRPVRLFSLLEYITQNVPIRAKKIGKSQHPVFLLKQISENFEVI